MRILFSFVKKFILKLLQDLGLVPKVSNNFKVEHKIKRESVLPSAFLSKNRKMANLVRGEMLMPIRKLECAIGYT